MHPLMKEFNKPNEVAVPRDEVEFAERGPAMDKFLAKNVSRDEVSRVPEGTNRDTNPALSSNGSDPFPNGNNGQFEKLVKDPISGGLGRVLTNVFNRPNQVAARGEEESRPVLQVFPSNRRDDVELKIAPGLNGRDEGE